MSLRLIPDDRKSENGNVFLAIFGAIALVGLLGASIMTFMKGPLSTSVRLTKMNTAENQMSIGAQVAVMATANQANNGDCDVDGYVEPIEWRAATTEPHPVNGGLVPLSLGISKKDPWGTEYGYCVWNHGSTTSGSGCNANMLAGYNARTYPVVALVSAGPDKAFTTTCRTFATADVNSDGDLLDATDLPMVSKAAETDDDVITTFTYEEATGVSGGLWSIKAGEPDVAIINKSIESSGVANLKGGVLLPDKSFIDCNDIANAGVMAKSGSAIEICNGAGVWTSIGGGGGGASDAFSTSATCSSAADAGKVRYNSTSGQPEFCNGVQWAPFAINTPGVNLVITPNSSTTMNVDGGTNQDAVLCTAGNGMTCGTAVTFTVSNQGTITSSSLVVELIQVVNGTSTTYSSATLANATNTSNFVIKTNTCSSTTLAVNATCTIVLLPKASGNTAYTASLKINTNNTPMAVLSGTASNFGCVVGRTAPGGNYVGCGLVDPDGAYDLVMNPSGCSGATNNPTCTLGLDTVSVQRSYGAYGIELPNVGKYPTQSWGAQQHQNMIYYSSVVGITLSAAKYCDDLNYQGQSDWFLPSYTEMQYIRAAYQAGKVTMSSSFAWYLISDQVPNYYTGIVTYAVSSSSFTTGVGDRNNTGLFVRCVRRQGLPLPSAFNDSDPDSVSIPPQVVFTASEPTTSRTVTMSGLLQTIAVSITGGTGMEIIKNGVATGLSSITGVKLSDTLAFKMNGPATMGTKSTATIQIGPDTYTWWIGYADSSKTVKGFVTSTSVRAAMGGLSGADATCNTYAATSTYGLSSSWKAFLSDSTTSASNHIPWNWGTLKTVTGNTIVDGGLPDLLDGSFDDFFNVTETGGLSTASIWTGSDQYGGSYNSSGTSSFYFSTDWTVNTAGGPNSTYGIAGSKGVGALLQGTKNSDDATLSIRCIEDIDSSSDTTPSDIKPPYIVQAATSSRQSSSSVIISGMSAGATTTLSVTATGGNPKFTINGGAEVSSGSIQNGDTVVLKLDAPATANTSNKMTLTAGTLTSYWRVWSGWDGVGSGIKRVFVTSTDPQGKTFGGAAGADPVCQARATAASLSGTWKAILSGTAEAEWAVNRVGYNWNELRLVDGTTTVAYAPNLWSTLLNPIIKTEFGVTRASTRVLSGTASDGRAYSLVNDISNQSNWTAEQACWATYMQGNSSALSAAITQGYNLCQSDGALYCIEQ